MSRADFGGSIDGVAEEGIKMQASARNHGAQRVDACDNGCRGCRQSPDNGRVLLSPFISCRMNTPASFRGHAV